MHQAAKKKQLYKEQPFVLGVDSGEIYPDTECRAQLLVQGIIDAYLLRTMRSYCGYKTDKVSPGRTGSDRSVSYTVGGLRSGIGTNVAEKSKGNIYLFIYTEKDDTVIMKISP